MRYSPLRSATCLLASVLITSLPALARELAVGGPPQETLHAEVRPSEASRMSVPCQQNRDNGKIILEGDFLPKNARYRVLGYSVEEPGDPWTTGKCAILLQDTAGR